MPLEISEIGVRLSVGDAPVQKTAATVPAAGHGPVGQLSREQMDEIVRACVTETLTKIRMAESR